MNRVLIFLLLVFSSLAVQAQQGPGKQELRETVRNINTILKRDSLNNLIIENLQGEVDSLKRIPAGPVTAEASESTIPPYQDWTHIECGDGASSGPIEPLPLLPFMLIAFTTGLLALLTPCVFPMVPLTVTFFTTTAPRKGEAIKKALFYGFSIVLIYSIIGLVISATIGPAFATFLSVHWVPNLIFFLIFFIFGLSFMGMFDINLPTSFVNRVDRQSEKGGYYGVFFMAFTLVLVSFSCTGPIVGSILIMAFQGEVLRPMFAMLAYSVAFAIPFTIFAVFPQLLNKLPKSGGWLNIVKVILGFLEFALALKFLSMIDQVYHLNILDREIYIAIWIVIFGLLGLYLLGKFRLPHDTEIKVVGVPRLILAMFPLVFSLYLFPGLFGAPLKALSGYLPPMYTHDFDLPGIIREYSTAGTKGNTLCDEPKYKGKFKLPHGIKGYFDYDQALACAREKKMPLFLDFTGHGCVNCREVEATVWSDPEVLKLLKNYFVMTSLYVDDFTKLPKEERFYSELLGTEVETIGEKNYHLEREKFGVLSQPYYVVLDPFTEKPLGKPMAYTTSVHAYMTWLQCQLKEFYTKYPPKEE